MPNLLRVEPSETVWFSPSGCLIREGKLARVFVGGFVVGEFTAKDVLARNLLMVGLSKEKRFGKGNLARTFGLTGERLWQLRCIAATEGLDALPGRPQGGRESKVSESAREQLYGLFATGAKAKAAFRKLGAKTGLSYRTICRVRQDWQAATSTTRSNSSVLTDAETVQENSATLAEQEPAQQALLLCMASRMIADEPASLEIAAAETAAPPEIEPTIEAQKRENSSLEMPEAEPPVEAISIENAPLAEVEDAPTVEAPVSESATSDSTLPTALIVAQRNVLHAGSLLLIAAVHALGLHEAVLKSWSESACWRGRLRVALDAIIVALGIGQKCVEGVRRLSHPSAAALLRATRAPSESWVRRILKRFLDEAGSIEAHLGMTQNYLTRARSEAEVPAVFYVDNHMRPYTGKRKLQKGWRMQDKRVRPGTTDYYVHDEDGRPLFRVDVPMHGTLGDWLTPITALLRQTLGSEQRILLAFDRGGAFATHLGALKQRGFEFVTYERGPYPALPKESFSEMLELEDETLRVCEESALLSAGETEVEVRRIALLTGDDRQVNVIAVSAESLERLVEIITGRWVQENGFKHGNERWGINQLDCRKQAKYAGSHVIVNPVRKRLEQALLIAREKEGTVRRQLARLKIGNPKRAALKGELTGIMAQQKTLEAERKGMPKHAFLKDTELADKLVYIDTKYKTLLDTIRIACINAESDLADVLRESLARPNEAKKVLRNLFAATGAVRVSDDAITVAIDMVGTDDERRAVQHLFRHINCRALQLPGDPLSRPLRFQI